MKKKIISLVVLMCFFMSGCFSYRDINEVLFVTGMIVDIDSEKNPVIYIETFKPYRGSSKGSEKGQRILFQATGSTILEAIRDTNLSSSYKINYTQNRAIIITERAAKYDMNSIVDFFDREQELILREYMAVYMGDPEKLIKLKLKEEEYIGIFLSQLITNQGALSRVVQFKLNDFLNERLVGSKTNLLTAIAVKEGQMEDKIEAVGSVVIKDDKMVEFLPKADGQKYNLLMNKVKIGTLEEFNPEKPSKFVTLEICDSKTKTNMNYDGKILHLKKIIDVDTTLGEVQGEMKFNKKNLDEIKKITEYSIKSKCTDFFNDYKKKNLDIFEVTQEFNRKYPKENDKNIFSKTEIDVETHVHIEGSTNTTNAK